RALIVAAQSLADERRHAEVLPLHLVAAAVHRDRRVADVFRRAGADPAELVRAADRLLSALPRAKEPSYLSLAMLDLIERAEREATRERRTAVSIGDVLNALSQEIRGPRGELLSSFGIDRKSTRLNSSHVKISYAVFCLKKKKNKRRNEGAMN